MVTKKQLGQLMRSRRQELGMSQEEVASQIPTSRSNYTKWENGEVEIKAIDVQTVARVLQAPLTYFFPPEQDEWHGEQGPVEAYFSGLPPGDVVREMVKAAYEASERQRTTHGRKAE